MSSRAEDPSKGPKPKPKAVLASVRRVLALAKPEWRRIALASFFLAIGATMGLAFPQAVRLILDEALGRKDLATVDRAAMAMAAIFAVHGVAVAMRYYLFSTVGERVVTTLREKLYRSIMLQEVGFFDERRTGELTNRLSSDTTVIQSTVSANISMFLRQAASIVGGVALLVYTSPKLTLLMLAVVPPVALGAVAYGRRVRKLSREVQDSLAESNEVAEETIAGLRTVRSFAAEEREAGRYSKAVNRSFELARKRILAASTFMGTASFLSLGAASLVLWFGGRMVVSGEMTVGSLTAFLIYSTLVAFSLGGMSDLWADFMKAAGSSERIFELIDRAPKIPTSGGARLEQVDGRIEFQNVKFAYPTRRDIGVLNGISFTIKPGEIVAVVGPSGAGKSTIASLLSRLYDPDDGRIVLDATDLRDLDPSWLRQQVGTVAQEPILFSTTIAENIRYARPDASDADIEAAARTANAYEFIQRFPQGFGTLVGERGIQLSGGQKQRVAIARAVLKNPRVLVLDEATSALDAESEHLVKDALDKLMKGRTTLVIAHRLSTVKDANRVLVLENGQIVQAGPHAALMREDGLYRRLVEKQFVAA